MHGVSWCVCWHSKPWKRLSRTKVCGSKGNMCLRKWLLQSALQCRHHEQDKEDGERMSWRGPKTQQDSRHRVWTDYDKLKVQSLRDWFISIVKASGMPVGVILMNSVEVGTLSGGWHHPKVQGPGLHKKERASRARPHYSSASSHHCALPTMMDCNRELGTTIKKKKLSPSAASCLRCLVAAMKSVTKRERGMCCDLNYTQVQSGRKMPEHIKQKATVINTI